MITITKHKLLESLALLSFLMLPIKASTLVTIAEDPFATRSSLSNTDEFDFNSLSTGFNYNVEWSGVGTFDKIYVRDANQYGGAVDETTGQGSRFSFVRTAYGIQSSTLNLNTSSSYFGMWWSAGDSNNLLTFYDGDAIVAQYSTGSMFGSLSLSQDYYGNPLTGQNPGQPYAFINFYGDNETSWNRIDLSQTGSGGFESDNYTTRVATFNPETDSQESLGNVIAEVSGTETTNLDAPSENWGWAFTDNAPGAPNPPMLALLFFTVAYIAKKRQLG